MYLFGVFKVLFSYANEICNTKKKKSISTHYIRHFVLSSFLHYYKGNACISISAQEDYSEIVIYSTVIFLYQAI